MKSDSKDKLVQKLSVCGQVAEHKSQKMQEHGISEERILSALTDDEKETLDCILTKLQKAWMEDHKAHHQRRE